MWLIDFGGLWTQTVRAASAIRGARIRGPRLHQTHPQPMNPPQSLGESYIGIAAPLATYVILDLRHLASVDSTGITKTWNGSGGRLWNIHNSHFRDLAM